MGTADPPFSRFRPCGGGRKLVADATLIFDVCKRLAGPRPAAPAFSSCHRPSLPRRCTSQCDIAVCIQRPAHCRSRGGNISPRRFVDPSSGRDSFRCRTVGLILEWRRSLDVPGFGNPRSHFGNDWAGRLVHRCPTLRQEANQDVIDLTFPTPRKV